MISLSNSRSFKNNFTLFDLAFFELDMVLVLVIPVFFFPDLFQSSDVFLWESSISSVHHDTRWSFWCRYKNDFSSKFRPVFHLLIYNISRYYIFFNSVILVQIYLEYEVSKFCHIKNTFKMLQVKIPVGFKLLTVSCWRLTCNATKMLTAEKCFWPIPELGCAQFTSYFAPLASRILQ